MSMCESWCLCCFKQKTSYVLRISDWSSDVCSSDLDAVAGLLLRGLGLEAVDQLAAEGVDADARVVGDHLQRRVVPAVTRLELLRGEHPVGMGGQHAGDLVGRHEAGVAAESGRASCREGVCQYV